MSDTDIKIKFDCKGFSAPAYSCSKSGDNSGVYVQSTDYDALVEQNKALRAALVELMDKASECDSWESFPIQYLDDAQTALEQTK